MTTTETVPLYRCEFERIGRTHNIEPQTFAARDADELAHVVFGFARKYLMSRDVEVVCNLSEGRGTIYAGLRTAGAFTIEVSS